MVYPDKTKYAGTWVNGKREGKGKLIFKDGREGEELWKADAPAISKNKAPLPAA
ncbi:hypothetical protein AGMMS49949_09840 [Alphaproteobacteria bacterium]|nr:hypothetical protein AGMMS49949_09840 [Alphaproteobacteria bacterium]GHS96912.1 hypothetical protein AGMMS50296_3430 [Alphaproteobacteria bacterium]